MTAEVGEGHFEKPFHDEQFISRNVILSEREPSLRGERESKDLAFIWV
jgi:hypothetical protein